MGYISDTNQFVNDVDFSVSLKPNVRSVVC